MRDRFMTLIAVVLITAAMPLAAEDAQYGEVTLEGLGHQNWPLNPNFATHTAMVCNVNGPDGDEGVFCGRVAVRALPVQGWAHDGYLCSFIH